MTPPARSAASAANVKIADPSEDASEEAVVWSGQHAVVVGSAGRSTEPPPGANPIFVDGAQYHSWLRAFDVHGGAVWSRRLERGRELLVRHAATLGDDVVIAGEQRAGDVRAYTGWVARMAADGSERWRVDALGPAGVTGLQAVAGRADGGVLAGGTRQFHAWLLEIDSKGKLGRQVDLPGLDEITAMIPAGETFVIAGIVGRTTLRDGTSRLMSIRAADDAASPRWTIELPERGPGELSAVAWLGDGGVAVGQAPDAAGHPAAWIVRFTGAGVVQSSQVLPAADSDAARAVAATRDGGFLVAGTSYEERLGARAIVWRFDAAGQLRWQRTYEKSMAQGIAATPDGGAIVVGSTRIPGVMRQPWVMHIDAQGAPRWTR